MQKVSLKPLLRPKRIVPDRQQEFSSLEEDANIYRLVGPVLLKQDSSEAKSTVDSRLGYIEQEMYLSPAFSRRTMSC